MDFLPSLPQQRAVILDYPERLHHVRGGHPRNPSDRLRAFLRAQLDHQYRPGPVDMDVSRRMIVREDPYLEPVDPEGRSASFKLT
jgi:hypothetical protein